MAQTAEEITVALSGKVYVAPYTTGLVLPTDMAAPDAAFLDLGYTTEDGVTFAANPTVEDIRAWQKQTPVRRIVTERDSMVSFSLLQTNLDTFALAFGGGEWTTAVGVHRYDPPADADALAEYAVIIDFADGARNSRIVTRRATMNDGVETQLVRNSAMVLPITLNALTPDDEDSSWFMLSDDPSYSAA